MSVLPDWLVFTAALACEGGLFLSIELKHRKIISGSRIYILVKNVCCVSHGSGGDFFAHLSFTDRAGLCDYGAHLSVDILFLFHR